MRCIAVIVALTAGFLISCCALHVKFHTETRLAQRTALSMVTSDTVTNNNIEFDGILNMRDLATACSEKIAPGKFFRTGCVSSASPTDVKKVESLGIKVWIDLRSEPEVEEDEGINSEIYNGSQSVHYDRKSKRWIADSTTSVEGKMRYFIALMSEKIIKKGTFERLRKRSKLAVMGLLPVSAISRRVNQKLRNIFLDKINLGGLQLLNELAIQNSPHAIVDVLKVITEESKDKGIGIFCTAGKDRTGLIAALTLSILGASDTEIINDYVQSDAVYSQLKSSARVASLKQNDLDPDIFLRAKAPVIIDTLKYIRIEYGSISAFLDSYGFDQTWRDKMIENMGKK